MSGRIDKYSAERFPYHRMWIGDRAIGKPKVELAGRMMDRKLSGCKRTFWDNTNSEALIKEQFSEYLDVFEGYKYDMQKADFVRHCVLYAYGGLYADLSFKIRGSLNRLLDKYKSYNVLFFVEAILPDDIDKDPKFKAERTIRKRAFELGLINSEEEHLIRIFSSLIYSRKVQHPIFTEIIEEASKRSVFPIQSTYDIVFTTGPDLVTHVVHQNTEKMKDIGVVSIDDWRKAFAWVRRKKTTSQWRDEISQK